MSFSLRRTGEMVGHDEATRRNLEALVARGRAPRLELEYAAAIQEERRVSEVRFSWRRSCESSSSSRERQQQQRRRRSDDDDDAGETTLTSEKARRK